MAEIAHHVAVSRHGFQQHALLGQPQRLTPGAHGGFRGADRVHRAEAAKQRLHHADLVAARIAVAVAEVAGLVVMWRTEVSALPVMLGR